MKILLIKKSCEDFVELLASKEPVPGGGGAAALVGSIGMALGNMVGNLTIGKKKYKDVEDDIKAVMVKAQKLQKDLLKLVDSDAEVFQGVTAAFKMPKDTEEQKKAREKVLEEALKKACMVPVEIIEKCYEAIKLQLELADKGSSIVISDVGVGALCLKSALLGGRLNVIINLNGIKDESFVREIEQKIEPLIREGVKMADEVYKKVEKRLAKK